MREEKRVGGPQLRLYTLGAKSASNFYAAADYVAAMATAHRAFHAFDVRTSILRNEEPWSDCWPDSIGHVEDAEALDEVARKNAPSVVLWEIALLLVAALALVVAIDFTLKVLHIH